MRSGGGVPDLLPLGAQGSTIVLWLPLSGLSGCLGNSRGRFPPIHGRSWVRGGRPGRKGGVVPLCWILYKEEGCN